MNKTEILKYLHENGLSPNKKLGQNFLVNEAVSGKIVDSAGIIRKTVIEIGPGLGSLTEILIQQAASVTAVEIDAGISGFLSEKFKNSSNIKIIHSDFLKYIDSEKYDAAVGNLPYYCSSEIIFHVIDAFFPETAVFMLQKEMTERLISKAGDAAYGALSASVSLYYHYDSSFNVDRHSFFPVPEVTSTVVKLVKNKNIPEKQVRDMFHLTVKSAFWGKRKTVLKSLSDSPFMNFSRTAVSEALEKSEIDEKLRAENISTEKFLKLAENLQKDRDYEI
ncbi:MAG: ribosomal RNA small subunit methyltransferase A [Spirochaetes bacterium]|nr:ribosomal RNA small subunit methyltransferase A [Spirochaetota bacterium]